MKKRIIFPVLALALLFSLFACGLGRVRIEDYKWKMRYVMHAENEQLIIDAASEEDSTHPEAKIIDITLSAKDGKITLLDGTNEKIYEGIYTVKQKTPAGTDYKITIDGKEGYATVAMTTYADGTQKPTLPINLGTYSIYFYAE